MLKSIEDILALPDEVLGNIDLTGIKGELYDPYTAGRAAGIRNLLSHIAEQAPVVERAIAAYPKFEILQHQPLIKMLNTDDGTEHIFKNEWAAIQFLGKASTPDAKSTA